MNLCIKVLYGDTCYMYPLLSAGDYQRIELANVFVLDVYKIHDHRYEFRGFFYLPKAIVGPYRVDTKKKLYGAIQFVLQKFL